MDEEESGGSNSEVTPAEMLAEVMSWVEPDDRERVYAVFLQLRETPNHTKR